MQLNDEDKARIERGDLLVVLIKGVNILDGGMKNESQSVDLSLFLPAEVKDDDVIPESAVTATTLALITSIAIQIMTNGSMSELWGAINGLQIAAFQPIVNISLPKLAGYFSASIAGIVTFEIPYVDLDTWTFGSLNLPDNDGILKDLEEEFISGDTKLGGIKWNELKDKLYFNSYFDR